MRILVIGAGALGGYFGGCLARAGRDVTFMVRPQRAAQLARDGLRIISPHGDFELSAQTVLAGSIREPFDVILVAVKAYSLEAAAEQFAPAVGSSTVIVPVVNGMRHIDNLCARFGEFVLGGMAIISATLDADGRVVQFLPVHDLTYGELHGGFSNRVRALSSVLEGAGFNVRASDVMMLEMWEKWVSLATVAGITCLMRAGTGDIIAAPGGQDAIERLLHETGAVAEASGFKPRPRFIATSIGNFTQPGLPLKASMLRDMERGNPTEGEHILGDMVARARALGIATPLLDLARLHVAAYELGRSREITTA